MATITGTSVMVFTPIASATATASLAGTTTLALTATASLTGTGIQPPSPDMIVLQIERERAKVMKSIDAEAVH
jgi:hypothetical protein